MIVSSNSDVKKKQEGPRWVFISRNHYQRQRLLYKTLHIITLLGPLL